LNNLQGYLNSPTIITLDDLDDTNLLPTKWINILELDGVYKARKNYSFRKHDGKKKDWPKTDGGNYTQTEADKQFTKWSRAYWKERAATLQ